MKYADIYQYILGEEAAFDQSIEINGWQWNFKQHVKTSFYYLHGRLLNGNNDDTPVKNIVRRIIKLQKTERDVDVKDINIYVDDPEAQHLSFLIKKYHDDVFVVENDIDTFIDDWLGNRIEYGGGLAKKGSEARPEVVDLQSVAFCDQTDMMKGPIAFKHFYNPAELMDMAEVGWGNPENGATTSLQSLIDLSESYRVNQKTDGQQNLTPGQYIEIYEVHGVLPSCYLDDSEFDGTYKRQLQIIGFYRTEDGKKTGETLFRKEIKQSLLKVTLQDKIYSRALGFGGVEELFEDQVWTNYSEIRKKEMLDAASKVILKAIGAEMKARYPNGLKDMETLQIVELNQNEDLAQIDTTPRSLGLFEKWEAGWEEHAQGVGFATNPLLGEEAPSGTPFSAQERQVIQGKGPHVKEQGRFAKDLENLYREWIFPHIEEKIVNGARFLSELSTQEMQYVIDKLADSLTNKYVIEQIFDGTPVTQEEAEFYKQKVREDFAKKGNKHFLEALKGEFKKKHLRIKVDIKGKQKNLALFTEKLVNIFRQIIANPQAFEQLMQIPEMSRTFNDILEHSGISPVYYSGLSKPKSTPTPSPLTPELSSGLTANNVV